MSFVCFKHTIAKSQLFHYMPKKKKETKYTSTKNTKHTTYNLHNYTTYNIQVDPKYTEKYKLSTKTIRFEKKLIHE